MRFTREQAVELDSTDPLAVFQDRYVPLGPDIVAYLDGNSLGRPLASIPRVWQQFAEAQWAGRLIRGWTEGWMELPKQVGDELGAAALGAAPGQTVIADSTTVNLYKTIRAALNLRPGRRRMIVDRDNFPTNRYVAESLARDLDLELVWVDGGESAGMTAAVIEAVIDERVAVVTLSHIAYRSGALADVAAITAAVHAAGAVVVWDLCHSVGSAPVELDAWQVDFAVGCTYKFLGAGPGAPAFIYAATKHHDRLDQPIWGWLGRKDSFAMEQGYEPVDGIGGMLSGTPPLLGILAVREGVQVVADAGIGAIRTKAVSLGEFAIDGFDAVLRPLGFSLASPRDSAKRGAHVSVARADGQALCDALIDRGIIPDFRKPDVVRLGLSPLTTRYVEVWDAIETLRQVAA